MVDDVFVIPLSALIVLHFFGIYTDVYFHHWMRSLFLHATLSILNAEIRNWSSANVAQGPKSSSR